MRQRRMMRVMCAAAFVVTGGGVVMAQQAATPVNPHAEVLLWANGAPGSEGKTAPEVVTAQNFEGEHAVSSIHKPSITPYLVRGAHAPVAAIIVAPGGGHALLSIDHEGYQVAQYLSGHGVAAFVLKYRLAREKGSTYTVEGNELDDIQRAIRLVRARAAEWGVDPARVGVMGFSAGGELAVMAATRFHADADPTHRAQAAMNGASGDKGDAIDTQSDKPAFQVLMYPGGLAVASAAGAANAAAGTAPVGGAPVVLKPEIVSKLGKETPPAFLLCGADDRPDIAQGVAELFVAMRRAGVSAEMHEYAGVGHGFGLRLSAHGGVADWPQVLVEWMDTKGFLRGK